MQFLAVVNPGAGGERCGKRAVEALGELRAAGLELEVATTTAPGQATELAREAWCRGQRHFVVVGGDGTGYELINGLFPLAHARPDDPAHVGFLPLGTGNSFLRDFVPPHTDSVLPHARAALLAGKHRAVDVVCLRHEHGELFYINLFAIGFAADVNARAARHKSWGELGYLRSVVAETLGLAPRAYPMREDGGAWITNPATFLAICNSKFTGGKMMMAPEASTEDGKVDVIRVGTLSRVGLLRALPRLFRGTHVDLQAVQCTQVGQVEFDLAGPTNIMLDGEALTCQPIELSVLRGALRVYA